MGLERGPLNLVATIEELLERNSSGSGLENQEDGRGDPSRLPRGTFYPQKFSLTSPTKGRLSVGVARSRTQATEFVICCCSILWMLYGFVGRSERNNKHLFRFVKDVYPFKQPRLSSVRPRCP
jgi:hypothetical protein